jgi:hypothetical protein
MANDAAARAQLRKHLGDAAPGATPEPPAKIESGNEPGGRTTP